MSKQLQLAHYKANIGGNPHSGWSLTTMQQHNHVHDSRVMGSVYNGCTLDALV